MLYNSNNGENRKCFALHETEGEEMYKSKDFTELRNWTVGDDIKVTIADIKSIFEEMIHAIKADIYIRNITIDDSLPAIALHSSSNSNYMGVYVYLHNNLVGMALEGKSEQIKAHELEKLFYRAAGVVSGVHNSYKQTKNIMARFGARGTGASIGAGVGVAAGAVIGGSVRLVAKGVKALLRNQEAYDREMGFYNLALGLGDYLIGGADTNNVIAELKNNAEKDNALAQYLLGVAYAEGRGETSDFEAAVRWFAAAALNGERRSREIIAYEYLFGEKEYSIEEKHIGLEYLEEMADAGDENAVTNILDIYGLGKIEGIPPDPNKLFEMAEKYADSGNMYACMVLAGAYDSAKESRNIDFSPYKNDEKAAMRYKQILQEKESQYIEEAAISLVHMYQAGKIADQNHYNEIYYLTIAASKGNIEAKTVLVEYYTFGIGTEKNYVKAQKLCDEIIRSGNQEAISTAYYCNYIIADESRKYKLSMDYARKYIGCDGAEADRIEELKEYLKEKENLISNMTDEERWAYLGEKKPLFYDFRKKIKQWQEDGNWKEFLLSHKKVIAIGCIAIVILIIVLISVHGLKGDEDAENVDRKTYSSHSNNKNEQYSEDYYEAMTEYKLMLAENNVEIADGEMWESSNCDFAVSYINDDDIPELLLYDFEDNYHVDGYGALFTYEDGAVNFVSRLSLNDVRGIGYYEGSGYYMDQYASTGYGSIQIKHIDDAVNENDWEHTSFTMNLEYDEESAKVTDYFIYKSETEFESVSEEEFYEVLNECTGNVDLTEYKFFSNNEENREQQLKSKGDSDDSYNDIWEDYLANDVIGMHKDKIEERYGPLFFRNSEEFGTCQDYTALGSEYYTVDTDPDNNPVFSFGGSQGDECEGVAGTAEQIFGINADINLKEIVNSIQPDSDAVLILPTDVSYDYWSMTKNLDFGLEYEIYFYPEALENAVYKPEYDHTAGPEFEQTTLSNVDIALEDYSEDFNIIEPSTYVVIINKNGVNYRY